MGRDGARCSSIIATTYCLAVFMSSFAAYPLLSASAQNSAEPRSRSAAPGSDANEMVIISNMKERKHFAYRLLNKLRCKNNGSVTGAIDSEVWSVPHRQMSRIAKLLEAGGMRVTKLREDWNHILKRHHGQMTNAQQELMKKAMTTPGAIGVHVMQAPEAALTAFAMTNDGARPGSASSGQADGAAPAPSTVVLPISPTQNITLQRVRYTTDQRGCVWNGTVVETGESALLMRWNDGRITGLVGYKGRIYTVESLGGHLHAMVEMDPRRMPPDHAALTATNDPRADLRPDAPIKTPLAVAPPAVQPLSDARRGELEAKPVTIDLMMLYTKKAARYYVRDPADMLAMAVEQTNNTFRNSGIGNISLRLVHAREMEYDEVGSEHFDHLYRMVDGVGVFKDIRKIRNEKKADIVGLVVDDSSGCGLSTRVAADAEDAYFVVHHSCASITISIAHEIGHILGARHDRAIDTSNTPFPYGHGYVNGKWRDIMSYQKSCEGCVRIPFWSNPRIMYQGEPTGTSINDNARVILEQAERVSNFR